MRKAGGISYMAVRIVKAVVLLLAILLQSTIGDKIAILGVTPGLVLIVVLSLCALTRSYEGIVYAGAAGVVIDLLWGNVFGVHTLLLLYTAVICYIINQHVYRKSIGIMCGGAFLFTFLYETLFYLLTLAMWGDGGSFGFLFMRIILPQCAYNAILIIPVHALLKRVDAFLGGKGGWEDEE